MIYFLFWGLWCIDKLYKLRFVDVMVFEKMLFKINYKMYKIIIILCKNKNKIKKKKIIMIIEIDWIVILKLIE